MSKNVIDTLDSELSALTKSPVDMLAAMRAEIAKLQAERDALAAAKERTNKVSFKVSPKGAVSAYGLQRFPVTLYREQWDRLFAAKGDFDTLVAANPKALATDKADALVKEAQWRAANPELAAKRDAAAAKAAK